MATPEQPPEKELPDPSRREPRMLVETLFDRSVFGGPAELRRPERFPTRPTQLTGPEGLVWDDIAKVYEGFPIATTTVMRGDDFDHAEVLEAPLGGVVPYRIAEDVLAYVLSIADKEWIAYDPSYQVSSGQVLVDAIDQVPGLERVTELALNAPRWTPGTGDILGMAHQLSVGGTTVTAYRLKGPGISARSRDSVYFAPNEGTFEPLSDVLLTYEPRFDALVVRDRVFVTAPTTLSRLLGSATRLRALARETVARATVNVNIEGIERLTEAVGSDPAMSAKMVQLARTLDRDPDYARLLTTENLLDFLDRNPEIAISTTGDGKDRRLVFESAPQRRWGIIKLLADDYLRSDLSKRFYEAGSKAQLAD